MLARLSEPGSLTAASLPAINSVSNSKKNLDFTIVCISNRPKNFLKFAAQFQRIPIQIISVVPNKRVFEQLELGTSNISYIESNSRNFSYLVNIGSYYTKTTYYVVLYDDEEVNDLFFDFIFKYNGQHESIAIKCIGCYGNVQLRFWTGMQPRIFRKGVNWKYRVHEKPILHQKPIERSDIVVINKSYQNWDELILKARRVGVREIKSPKRFLVLFFGSFYLLFFRGGLLDKFTGIKVLLGSIYYAFYSFINGMRGHNYYSLREIEERLDDETITSDDRFYIQEVLEKIKSKAKMDKEEYEEELEQISSPFTRVL